MDDEVVMSDSDIDYGIISNITPLWWRSCVLFENTKEGRYLSDLEKYPPDGNAALFFPELLLNVNQQRDFQRIIAPAFYGFKGTIRVKTASPFIIQCCSTGPAKRGQCWFAGRYKAVSSPNVEAIGVVGA